VDSIRFKDDREGQTMRRLLFTMLTLGFVGMGSGCNTTHGVCDCSSDFEQNCAYRAPWVPEAGPAPVTPEPMPEIREALPNAPKKL
jgi:hypothetical protein